MSASSSLTLVDILEAIVAITLSAKAVGTIVLLVVGKDVRDRPGWGSWVWWMTKVTSLIAVPCAIAIACLQGQTDVTLIFAALAVFVMVALPWKIRQRQARIARHRAA